MNALTRCCLVFTAIYILSPGARSEEVSADQIEMSLDWLVELGLLKPTILKPTKEKLNVSVKEFQMDQDLEATGQMDVVTWLTLSMAHELHDLKLQGKLVEVEVPLEGLKQIHKLPPVAVFYMSKSNTFISLDEVNEGEYGVFDIGWHAELSRNVTFRKKARWNKGQVIGGAHWGQLFHKQPQLKLFVTDVTHPIHERIGETGGGIRIAFVLKKSDAKPDETKLPRESVKKIGDSVAEKKSDSATAAKEGKLSDSLIGKWVATENGKADKTVAITVNKIVWTQNPYPKGFVRQKQEDVLQGQALKLNNDGTVATFTSSSLYCLTGLGEELRADVEVTIERKGDEMIVKTSNVKANLPDTFPDKLPDGTRLIRPRFFDGSVNYSSGSIIRFGKEGGMLPEAATGMTFVRPAQEVIYKRIKD